VCSSDLTLHNFKQFTILYTIVQKFTKLYKVSKNTKNTKNTKKVNKEVEKEEVDIKDEYIKKYEDNEPKVRGKVASKKIKKG
jgi:hypothetical protein